MSVFGVRSCSKADRIDVELASDNAIVDVCDDVGVKYNLIGSRWCHCYDSSVCHTIYDGWLINVSAGETSAVERVLLEAEASVALISWSQPIIVNKVDARCGKLGVQEIS